MESIYTKLAAVQAEMPAMKKNTEGYKYKYFDINQMLEVLKPLFKKHGVQLLQPLTVEDGNNILLTIVKDNESQIVSKIKLPENQDPQKIGSAITYYRRYALQSLLAMEAEDDDGASAKPTIKNDNFEL